MPKNPYDNLAITRLQRTRVVILALLLFPLFLVLVAALFLEQVGAGNKDDEKIRRQSVRRIRIPSLRGKIFTEDKVAVADNRTVYNLVFYPEEMRQRRRRLALDYMTDAESAMATAIGRQPTLTREDFNRLLNVRPGLPIKVFEDLNSMEMARAAEVSRNWRGIEIQTDSVRVYPHGSLAANIIGYTRSQDPESADDRGDFFYYLPDQIGRSGVEKAFDEMPDFCRVNCGGLRGSPGYSLAQVNNLGYVYRNLIDKIEPVNGNHVVLTINYRAQKIAESLLRNQRGALVVIDADNGDVLAAATAPSFDLRNFAPKLTKEHYKSLLEDPGKPLNNRALQGIYAPGSIIKPLSSLAFLQSGILPEDEVMCDGGVEIGNARIRCAAYRRGGHGVVNMMSGLAYSCNCYVIENALKIGFEPLSEILTSAGVGEKTGLEIPESSGIAPSPELKKKLYRYAWNSYDTALLSMGQGIIGVTPVQAALFCAALANGGTLWRTHLVKQVVDFGGNVLYEREVVKKGQLAATSEQIETVRQGMYQVVNATDGSGHRAMLDELKIYGKTGTAESGPRAHRRQTTWFIAFTEYEGRRYALAVVIEDGASGGKTCAPLAADFFRRFLLKN